MNAHQRRIKRRAQARMDAYEWVYLSDYYDGPISGMVRSMGGEMLWASMDALSCSIFRRYDLFRMPPEWMAEEAKRHAFWLECCGSWSYDKPVDWAPTRPVLEFFERYPSEETRERHAADGELVGTVKQEVISYPQGDAK